MIIVFLIVDHLVYFLIVLPPFSVSPNCCRISTNGSGTISDDLADVLVTPGISVD